MHNCIAEYYKGGGTLYLRTGWSSSLNRYGRRLLTQEADLVTTHGTIIFFVIWVWSGENSHELLFTSNIGYLGWSLE